MQVFEAVTLASGLTLANRLVKAAMEENLAMDTQLPSHAIFKLYDAWAHGGAGLIITGNVMVDPLAMTGPAGISLHRSTDITRFKRWSSIAQAHQSKIIMQLNHPGRQVYKNMGGKVLAPSEVALDLGKHSGMFSPPKAMSEDEIEDVINRFAISANKALEAGFDGVQIHAAHGYLISQFLSGLVNKRDDKWGGSLENRARLLIEIVKRLRQNLSSTFSISVKLNSADFQKGGFDISDAMNVIKMLEPYAIDFVELSGGSYEAPAMQGTSADTRTLAREAYFLEFAEQIAKNTMIPIMTTGGIKRLTVANKVVQQGVTLVGIASAMAFTPDLPNVWKVAPQKTGFVCHVSWKNKTMAALATMATVRRQLQRIGNGKHPKINCSPLFSLLKDRVRLGKLTKRYRKNIVARKVVN